MAKKKKTMGRPRTIIDWRLVDNLLAIFCTGEEIASVLNISYDTLARCCKRDKGQTFAEFYPTKRGGGKASLRKKQWLLADSNPAMAIFLGKNYLEQSDKLQHELTGKDGKPLIPRETKITVKYCKVKK